MTNKTNPVRWLRYLMYIHLISIANSLIGWLPITDSLTTWVSNLILLSVTVVMFCLTPVCMRYKKSGLCRTAWLGCVLIHSFLYASGVLVLAASLLSIIAVYQEYAGHAEIVAEKDSKLSKNWGSLFGWNILISVLTSVVSTAVAIFVVTTEVDASSTLNITMAILDFAQLVVDGVYLCYLTRTIRLLEPET